MSFLSRLFSRRTAQSALVLDEARKIPRAKEAEEPAPGPRAPLSPLSIAAIERLADSGDLTMAADLCREFMGDARVMAALTQRIGGLLALPIDWEDGAKKSARVKKAIVDDFPEGVRECDLFSLYSWGLLLGVAVAEILWKEGQSGRLIPTLKIWDPRFLRYDRENNAWKVMTDGGGEADVTPGDGHWVLYCPKGERTPWRNGLWRALNKPYFVKADSSLSWARFNEVHGSPIRVFTGRAGMSQRQLDAVADSIDTSRGFTSAAIPEGSKLELVEATGQSMQTFQAAIEWAGTEISIAILGQNLTTKVDGGSYAAAQTHRDVEQAIIEADAETESTFLREQVLSFWAAWNFGDAALAPWPRRETAEPEDLAATAAVMKGCGEAVIALQNAGFGVDLEAIAERFGIPLNPDAPILEREWKGEGETAGGEEEDEPEEDASHLLPAGPGSLFQMAALSEIKKDKLPKGADKGFDRMDAMADRAEKAAKENIEDASDIVSNAIEEATDAEDLTRRLTEAFPDMEEGEFNSLLERALILAEISGRWSALGDV
jgi:phage gp29-like protein